MKPELFSISCEYDGYDLVFEEGTIDAKLSFGDLAYLVDFYSVLYNEPIISNKFMNAVRDIRNASAHSNCLINKLFEELPATQQPDAEIKDDWSYDKTEKVQ